MTDQAPVDRTLAPALSPPLAAGAPTPPPARRLRATGPVLSGRRRVDFVAARLGVALRDARWRTGRSQAECARNARVSQARWSDLERGRGGSAPLELWAIAAAAVGQEMVAFLDQAPGSDLPRDIEHVRRQSAIVSRAASGGWAAEPELRVVGPASGRVIDVLLSREARGEAAVIEIWDWLADVGAALRSFDEKVAAVRAMHPTWSVGGAWVLRGTRRNRALVAELAPLFQARFPARGRAWLDALARPDRPMPPAPGLLWTDAPLARLTAARRR